MQNKHVVIIGAGLGGLQVAYILAKNGMRVTVLEHSSRIGGCLQSFQRGKFLFDTGFHYVGGLDEGQSLYGLFKYFNLLDLPWHKLDEDCFDEVVIGNRSFPFAVGHERFAEALSGFFPHERQNLHKYADFLKSVGDHITDAFLPREASDFYGSSLFARSAYEFLCSTIGDPLLRKVLSATSLKMELNEASLPLYVFAQINNSFIQSAWRIRGRGQQIAEHLADDIRRMGGVVQTNSTVTSIATSEGLATGVFVNGKEFVEADTVVCDIHPQEMLRLLEDSQSLRKVYRHRMASLDDTFGMFTAYVTLRSDAMPYLNRNLFLHKADTDLWNPDTSSVNSLMVSFYPDQQALDLLTPIRWKQVEQWAENPFGHRGDDYLEFKRHKAEECIRMAESRLPLLRDAVDKVYTSTPLSYQYYTHTHSGSAYGIRKDWRSPVTTVLTPKTPLRNVLLTGQNLNLHGVLGVSMTSVFTASELIGMSTLIDQLDVKHWT